MNYAQLNLYQNISFGWFSCASGFSFTFIPKSILWILHAISIYMEFCMKCNGRYYCYGLYCCSNCFVYKTKHGFYIFTNPISFTLHQIRTSNTILQTENHQFSNQKTINFAVHYSISGLTSWSYFWATFRYHRYRTSPWLLLLPLRSKDFSEVHPHQLFLDYRKPSYLVILML